MVSSVYLPGHKQSAETALSAAEESLRIYNDRIGRYPYTELELVEAPMRYALGVEFPEIVLISSDLYQTPERPEFSVTAAHEVAHQWWYNLVGNDVFEEPWLDEALATYSSALYYEAGPGGGSARGLTELWQERYNHMLKAGGDDLVTQGLPHFEGAGQDADYGGVVYIKGALFLAALRDEIGDAAFFDGLQSYFQEFQYKIAATPDLLEAFEQSSGRDLDDIYQEWLYSTAD
jgi:aminopeptidase N